MLNTPYCQASFPGHWQNICPEEFAGSLTQTHDNYLPLIHRPSNTRQQWQTPSHLSATSSCIDCLCGHTLSSSAVQVKRHHRIWVAFIFSVQNKAKGQPQRCLKQPHYFGHRKLPKCGTAGTTHLDPKTKAGIRETLVHLEIAHSHLASTWSIPNQHVSKRQHPSIHSHSAPKLTAELQSLLPEGN